MKKLELREGSALSTAVAKWRQFWFTPEPTTTLGLIRIFYGLLMIVWALALRGDLYDLFGEKGVLPTSPISPYSWGLLKFWETDQALLVVWVVLLLSAIALTVGWHSRIAALLLFVCLFSLWHRNPFVFNNGDLLLRIEALMLALAPCGAALSLDRRRTNGGSIWPAQIRAPWIIRLMQVEVCLIYLTTVRAKLDGNTWNDGTAVSFALRYGPDSPIVPDWLLNSPVLINLFTWGALAIELAIGIFVWNKKLRPWVLGAGVLLHLTIMVTIHVAFFSFAIFILYLAFVSPDTVERLIRRPEARAELKQKLMFWRRNRPIPVAKTPSPVHAEEEDLLDDYDDFPEEEVVPVGAPAHRRVDGDYGHADYEDVEYEVEEEPVAPAYSRRAERRSRRYESDTEPVIGGGHRRLD